MKSLHDTIAPTSAASGEPRQVGWTLTPAGRAALDTFQAKKFSTPEQYRCSQLAEVETLLCAREVFRSSSESDCGMTIFPFNPRMRCQLGKQVKERRTQSEIDGVRYGHDQEETLFHLIAYGRTWSEAVAMARRLGHPEVKR